MIGTLTVTGIAQKKLEITMRAAECLKAAGQAGRSFIKPRCNGRGRGNHKYLRHGELFGSIRAFRRCVELEKQFPVVTRDASCTRMVKRESTGYNDRGPTEVEIPLIFYAQLPVKRRTKIEIPIEGERSHYEISATSPVPTVEATRAIAQHREKFDHLEVWWVPNDVLVEIIPDPDPLLVGVIDIPNGEKMYFELHRWIDESVESGWWAREGY